LWEVIGNLRGEQLQRLKAKIRVKKSGRKSRFFLPEAFKQNYSNGNVLLKCSTALVATAASAAAVPAAITWTTRTVGTSTTVAATASTAVTAAAAARRTAVTEVTLWTSFVDLDLAATELSAVEGADSILCLIIIELNEAETTGFTGITIADNGARTDRTILFEQLTKIGVGYGEI
jgi:hypothetical protein